VLLLGTGVAIREDNPFKDYRNDLGQYSFGYIQEFSKPLMLV
jgi:hypothetical protein